jgi:Lipocalin-like domain
VSAQSIKERLVGTWALVTCEVVAPDGARSALVVGSNPAGQYIFTEDGHFSFQAVAEFGPFLSNDRMKTTPEEDRAAMRGSIAYYGTFTVNEADRTIAVHIERSSFPNQNGTDGKRVITALSTDEMSYINPGRRGGGSIHCTYKRAK